MKKPSYIAGFDSASAMLIATGKGLQSEGFPAVGSPRGAKAVLKATRFLPREWRAKLFTSVGAREGIAPAEVARVDPDEASRWAVSQYPNASYPGAVVGSASGALVYWCTAMGMPWLPQTFLMPVKGKTHPDDPRLAIEQGRVWGEDLVRSHPEIELAHMHDPVQDRRMVSKLTYFRFKRRTLGADYEAFLEQRVRRDGMLIVSECTSQWPTTQVAPRHTFQFGGMGGATHDELFNGGPRVQEFLEGVDADVTAWDPPEPDGERPESEWGFAEPLRDDAIALARRNGWPVRRLVFDHPDSLSPMVADMYRWWYRRRGITANRLFIPSFAVNEPYWALRTGSVPFWMFFNEETSLAHLNAYLDGAEPYDEILLTLVQNAIRSIGQPGPEAWQEVLDRARVSGRYAGTSLEEFPYDMSLLGSYDSALKGFESRHRIPAPLTIADFEEFLAQAPEYPGVDWIAA